MHYNYDSFIQIINFHGLFHNVRRCRKTGACRILVPLQYSINRQTHTNINIQTQTMQGSMLGELIGQRWFGGSTGTESMNTRFAYWYKKYPCKMLSNVIQMLLFGAISTCNWYQIGESNFGSKVPLKRKGDIPELVPKAMQFS